MNQPIANNNILRINWPIKIVKDKNNKIKSVCMVRVSGSIGLLTHEYDRPCGKRFSKDMKAIDHIRKVHNYGN